MTWKPTEGLRRAEHIVRDLAEDGAQCHNNIGPILQHRMMQVIARAIDVALEDGMPVERGDAMVEGDGASARLATSHFDSADPTVLIDTAKRGRKPKKAKKLRRPTPKATAMPKEAGL